VRVKSQYRQFKDGGAVTADDAVTPDVRAPQINPALEVEPSRPEAITEEQRLIENLEMPSGAKAWLKERPQYVFDPQENAKIQVVHHKLVGEGFEPYSPSYFAEAEKRLAEPEVDRSAVDEALGQARAAAPVAEDVFQHENSRVVVRPRRQVSVSAPPSRTDTITASYLGGSDYDASRGRVTLSRAELEAAAISGISPEEYGRQKLRLRQEKEAGHYTGGQ
jgi:hypothetical protein